MDAKPEKLNQLLQLLHQTADDEIDCDMFWEMAAHLAEIDMSAEPEKFKAYLHHLELCPGCAEELALLKEMTVRAD